MRFQEINTINELFFSCADVAQILNIQENSAKVLCSRYVKSGVLIRIKRDLYVLRNRWEYFTEEENFQIANRIQIPSYISLTTALSYYGITTQLIQNTIESIAIKRTFRTLVETVDFRFYKVGSITYGGFEKRNGVFIATPEKALADALYLSSIGRYSLDFSAIEFSRIDFQSLDSLLSTFPDKTKILFRNYAKSQAA
jgi:predicted transcriptional regulator of viral defense system